MKLPISLCSVVLNESHRIQNFIDYHKNFFNQIIICDKMSSDGTTEIIQKNDEIDLIIDRHRGIAEPTRHLCALRAKNDWILFLDADEIITEEFIDKLNNLINDDYDGYILERHNFCDDIFQCSETNQYRLFKKQNVYFHFELHGGIEPTQNTRCKNIQNAIIHKKNSQEYKIDYNIYESIILNTPESVNPQWYIIYQVMNFPLEQLITFVSTTSGKHDMSVDKIDSMLKSYEKYFGIEKFNKVIVADGFNEIRNENNHVYDKLGPIRHEDYRKYMDDLRPYCIHNNISLIELHENKGMYGAMLEGTMRVGTPFYIYTPDDIYAKREINVLNILRGMSEDLYIKRVNFHDNQLGFSQFQTILETANNKYFNSVKTNFLSGNTHIGYTSHANYVWGRRIRELGKYPLELAFQKEYNNLIERRGFYHADRQFGLRIYGNIGDEAVVEHDFSYLESLK